MNDKDYINNEFKKMSIIFNKLEVLTPKILEIISICAKSIKDGHKIIFCGNGGSASQSQHLCAELVGRYRLERKAINAISLSSDTSNLTAIGNDYGFDNVFSRQLEGIGIKGDVLIGLSTSGNSINVINAFNLAKEKGIISICFSGKDGGKLLNIADYSLVVPENVTTHIQECHLAIGHLMCDLIEKKIYGGRND